VPFSVTLDDIALTSLIALCIPACAERSKKGLHPYF
jgi:hypothetical protein